MFISNILKQNRANKELQDRLTQNIESTATLLRAVDSENQNTAAIESYEEVNKIKKAQRQKLITFTYPQKTVKEADIDHHRRVHEAEVTFRQELTQWNDRLFTANQADRDSRPIDGQEEGAVAAGSRVRIADCKPTFIKPAETVVKIGDTHFEIKLERQLNPETERYEWRRQDMETLERPEPNDVNMEDSCITYENKEKSKIDWESTLKNIKEYGEQLGYSKRHYLRCLLRIMGQNNDDLFLTYKEEEDPEKIANSLLAKYIGVNKKKLFENKLKTLTRVKGQSIRDVMTQADILADRILQNCRDPQEKAFRKHQIMLDALKSFCSEENAKELVQALKGSSLSGERADIAELIDTIEIAEKVNESSKPTRDMVFMNDKTAEKCEIFTLNTGKGNTASDGTRALEDTIQKTKELSLRGREERKRQNSHERYKIDNRQVSNRGRSREHRRGESTNQRSQSRDSRMNHRNDRDWSKNRNPRDRDGYRNRDNRSDRNFSRENSRERGYSKERDTSRNWRRDDRRDSSGWNNGATNSRTENFRRTNNTDRDRRRDNSNSRWEQSKSSNHRGSDDSRNSQRNRDDSRNNQRHRDDSRNSQRPRDDSRNRQWNREFSRSRQGSGDYPRYRQGSRDDSRNRQTGREGARYRSQSRDSSRRTVPKHKRNLEGVEFPPHTQMDLTVRFCVKCHNTLEQHYPWDCKLYRYWSNTPCEICYNGQHRSKECRKNPNRVDAFTVMLEHMQVPNTENTTKPSYSPF